MSEDVEETVQETRATNQQDDEIRAYEEAQQLELVRQERNRLLLQSTEPIFNALYKSYAYEVIAAVSRENRKRLGFQNVVTLSYAEASYTELLKLLARLMRLGLSETFGGHFVDLGSGSGRMIFAAALYHDFLSVTGIEILDDLYNITKKVLSEWDNIKDHLPAKKQDMAVKVQLGDCCYTDWSHADIVWCNATCFDTDIVEMIAQRAMLLKPGSFLLLVTKKLPSSVQYFFDEVDTAPVRLNWGEATVYYYRRNRVPDPTYIANKSEYVGSIIRRKALPVFDPRRAKLIPIDDKEAKS